MGGHISRPSNKTMVDRLVERNCYISSQEVEGVFRAVDRAMYFEIDEGEPIDPYEDDPWRRGNLHLSAPCIYAKVVEALNLKPGLSFLNLGSGTGYLSTIIGLLVGPNGVNHGIELHADVIDYAYSRLEKFKQKSFAIDKYEFSEPIFIKGNCLNLNPDLRYDRIYLGAACLPNMELFIKKMVKPNGGILVMPIENHLVRHIRLSESDWKTEKLMDVNFTLMIGRLDEDTKMIEMPTVQPKSLRELCRIVIRDHLRNKINYINPNLLNSDNVEHRRKRRARAQRALLRSNRRYSRKNSDNCCCNRKSEESSMTEGRPLFEDRATKIQDSSSNRIITRSKSQLLLSNDRFKQSIRVNTTGPGHVNHQSEDKGARSARQSGSNPLKVSDSASDGEDTIEVRHRRKNCSRARRYGDSSKTNARISSYSSETTPELSLRLPPPPLVRSELSNSSPSSSPRSSDSESTSWSDLDDCERWYANHIRQVRLCPRYFPPEPYELQYSSDSSGSSDYEELLSDYSGISSDSDWESVLSIFDGEPRPPADSVGIVHDSDVSMASALDFENVDLFVESDIDVDINQEVDDLHNSRQPSHSSSNPNDNPVMQPDQQPVASRLRSKDRLLNSDFRCSEEETSNQTQPSQHNVDTFFHQSNEQNRFKLAATRNGNILPSESIGSSANNVLDDKTRACNHCCSHRRHNCRHKLRSRFRDSCKTSSPSSKSKPSSSTARDKPSSTTSGNSLQQPMSLSPSSSASSSRLSLNSNMSTTMQTSAPNLSPTLFRHRLSRSFMIATDIGATFSMWTRSGSNWPDTSAGRPGSSSVSDRLASVAAAIGRVSQPTAQTIGGRTYHVTSTNDHRRSQLSSNQRLDSRMGDKSLSSLRQQQLCQLAGKRKRDQPHSPRPHDRLSSFDSDLSDVETDNCPARTRSATCHGSRSNYGCCNHPKGRSRCRVGSSCDCSRRRTNVASVNIPNLSSTATPNVVATSAMRADEGNCDSSTSVNVASTSTLQATIADSQHCGAPSEGHHNNPKLGLSRHRRTAAYGYSSSTTNSNPIPSFNSTLLSSRVRQVMPDEPMHSQRDQARQRARACLASGSSSSGAFDTNVSFINMAARNAYSPSVTNNHNDAPTSGQDALTNPSRLSHNDTIPRLKTYVIRDDESASRILGAVTASLRPAITLTRDPSDDRCGAKPACQRHSHKHRHNCTHHRNHHHNHQHHHHHNHRNNHRHHHHQNCRHEHNSGQGTAGGDVYLCRNHRRNQTSHQKQHQRPPSKRIRVSTDPSRRRETEAYERPNSKRRHEDECEKYHNHMSGYIRDLPLPKVLLTYLNCDRSL